MVLRENQNNAYAKFGGTNKEYYGIFRSGLYNVFERQKISRESGRGENELTNLHTCVEM